MMVLPEDNEPGLEDYVECTDPADETFVTCLAQVLEHLISFAPPEESIQSTRFHAIVSPGITVHEYLQRIARYYGCSHECFVLALIYIDRVVKLQPEFTVSVHSIHRLVMTAVLLAVKFFDDQFYSNKYYAKVGGVKTKEINTLEASFLLLVRYQLFVTPGEYSQYRSRVVNVVMTTGLMRQPDNLRDKTRSPSIKDPQPQIREETQMAPQQSEMCKCAVSAGIHVDNGQHSVNDGGRYPQVAQTCQKGGGSQTEQRPVQRPHQDSFQRINNIDVEKPVACKRPGFFAPPQPQPSSSRARQPRKISPPDTDYPNVVAESGQRSAQDDISMDQRFVNSSSMEVCVPAPAREKQMEYCAGAHSYSLSMTSTHAPDSPNCSPYHNCDRLKRDALMASAAAQQQSQQISHQYAQHPQQNRCDWTDVGDTTCQSQPTWGYHPATWNTGECCASGYSPVPAASAAANRSFPSVSDTCPTGTASAEACAYR